MATANQPEGKKVTDHKGSKRTKAYNSTLEEALAQPGINELMEAYGNSREATTVMATANQPENKKVTDHKRSERTRDYDSMLEEALAQPGINELMEAYGHSREASNAVGALRRAAAKKPTVMANNSGSGKLRI